MRQEETRTMLRSARLITEATEKLKSLDVEFEHYLTLAATTKNTVVRRVAVHKSEEIFKVLKRSARRILKRADEYRINVEPMVLAYGEIA